MRTMRVWGVLIAAAVVLVATACGVDPAVTVEAGATGGAPGAARTLLAASTATDAVTTGRFSMTGSTTGASSGDASPGLSFTGAFDRAAKASSIDGTLTGVTDTPRTVSVRTIDQVLYLNQGDAFAGLGLHTPWVSVDLANLAGLSGLGGVVPGTGPTTDPHSFLDLLRGVSGEVADLGREQVRGEATTHYRAQIVPSKALAQLPAADRSGLAGAFGGALDTPMPVDVWVDGQGLLRKGSFAYDQGSETATVTFELYDLGEPVSITPPPADQVTAAESLPLLKELLGPH